MLCDPMWQVTLRSSEMEFHEELYHLTLAFNAVFSEIHYVLCD